ncbi:MAG: hypothetical protein Q9224_001018 [Gallowayella concinna]
MTVTPFAAFFLRSTMWNLTMLCLHLILFRTVTAVSVTLRNEYEPGDYLSMTCPNLQPGQCCTAPRTAFRGYAAHVVDFRGLGAWQIAAIWRLNMPLIDQVDSSTFYTGCSGKVWRSRTGPGAWTWEMWGEPGVTNSLIPVTGASYIELPKALPPDEITSNWLDAEGVLGLVWGGGRWFSSSAASKMLGYGGGIGPRSQLRRDIRSRSKGKVYAGSPRRWVFPSYIEFNGTRYTGNSGTDDANYRDELGAILNLTQIINA